MLLLDSSFLIDLLHGNSDALAYIKAQPRISALHVHPVVRLELLAGAANRMELRRVSAFLGSFAPVPVQPEDWDHAIQVFQSMHLVTGIDWADALIAATCRRRNFTLITLNEKHFRTVPGLVVLRPY